MNSGQVKIQIELLVTFLKLKRIILTLNITNNAEEISKNFQNNLQKKPSRDIIRNNYRHLLSQQKVDYLAEWGLAC